MKIGRVTGQVVATVRVPSLPSQSLLLVELMGADGNPTGECGLAMDPIGAGEGEWVVLTSGSSARKAFAQDPPVDLAIIGIIDQVSAKAKTFYKKG